MFWQKIGLSRITKFALILLMLAGVLVVALDWHDIVIALREALWQNVVTGLLFTAISYIVASFSLTAVYNIFNIRLPKWQMFQIGFLSFVSSYLIALGGLTGVSVRLILMKRRGVATEDIVAPSLFHSYFYNLVMISLVPLGLFYLFQSSALSPVEQRSTIIAAIILSILLALATALLFYPSLRAAIFAFLVKSSQKLVRRDIAPSLTGFEKALVRGLSSIRQKPYLLAWPLFLIVLDWVSSAVALWFCFASLHVFPGIGVLLCGFVIGISAGLLSLIPAGLGVQELSMAGVFYLLGVPFDRAMLAAILFRLIYYFVPFIIGLGFFYHELKE